MSFDAISKAVDKRIALPWWDEPGVMKSWEEEEAACSELQETCMWIANVATDLEFRYLGEIFENLARKFANKQFIDCIKKRATELQNVKDREAIKVDIGFAEGAYIQATEPNWAEGCEENA